MLSTSFIPPGTVLALDHVNNHFGIAGEIWLDFNHFLGFLTLNFPWSLSGLTIRKTKFKYKFLDTSAFLGPLAGLVPGLAQR